MAYCENGNLRSSDYTLLLILLPQLQNITQLHQIMCGCEICIQDGTYQESLNNWHDRRLRYIKNHGNLLTRGSFEKFNIETNFTRYSNIVLTDG